MRSLTHESPDTGTGASPLPPEPGRLAEVSRGWRFASAACVLLPLASATASASGFGAAFLPLALLVASIACWRARASAADERSRAFWGLLAVAGSIWAASATLDALLVGGWMAGPGAAGQLGSSPAFLLGLDVLQLFGYLPIFLALDLRPHRYGRLPLSGPDRLRQLQGAGLLWLGLGIAAYLRLAPMAVAGTRMDGRLPAALDLVTAVLLGAAAARTSPARDAAPEWRWMGCFLAGAFGVFAASRGWSALPWPAAPSPSSAAAWALAPALWIAAARGLGRGGAGAADLDDTDLDDTDLDAADLDAADLDAECRGRWSPFRVPVVLSVSILPALHVTLSGGAAAPAADLQRLLVLVSIVLGTPLALLEHALSRRRSARLEIEQRRAAEESEERTVYLHSLIEHIPLAIVVLDPEHRVRLCNPAFERLFLYRGEEVVGSTLDQLIADEALRDQAAAYTAAVQSGQSVHATTRRLRSDGTGVHVELYGVPLMREGRPIGIFAIYQDVSDRQRSERALRDSEERFRRLAEAAFEGIVVSDGGVIHDCNEQYARLVDSTVREVIGRPVLDFVDPSHWEMVKSNMRRGYDRPYEHRALRVDRRVRLVEARGRSMPYAGRTMRVTAVRDITAQKRLEEEVRQVQKMEAVGRLAGGIAHDFNNLLTVIRGYGQLLALQVQKDELRGLVDEILLASERASLMTQRLLAFGRKQAVKAQVIEFDDVVTGMEKMLRRLIRADIRFDIRLDSGGSHVRADPGQLEQVILNLAINAGDAMPEGGTLSVETAIVEIERGVHRAGGPMIAAGSYVLLRVRDTGTGMDDSTRGQVFEPFFTTKAQGKGTGLGLATVYHIVKQSGGAIDVISEVGEGTTFDVYLPRVPEKALEQGVTAAPEDLPGGRETVLVVEDEPGVRALAMELLELHGYRVLEAEDGEVGLRRLEELGPEVDLVLTDVVMPGMNGPEMVRRLLEHRSDTRVLYMSGYTDEILGRDDPALAGRLVHKPFSVEELMVKVRETLDDPDIATPVPALGE